MAIPNLRPDPAPAPQWTRLRLGLLGLAAALVAGLVLLVGGALDRAVSQPAFLQAALGERAPQVSLVRAPTAGTTVRLREGGYHVDSGSFELGLRSVDDAGADGLERYEDGVGRRTSYGWEVSTVTRSRTEQFLTVARRQGQKTWRWELETLDLTPRVGADGRITFVHDDGLITSPAYLDAVRILAEDRREVSPKVLGWSVAQTAGRWLLEL